MKVLIFGYLWILPRRRRRSVAEDLRCSFIPNSYIAKIRLIVYHPDFNSDKHIMKAQTSVVRRRPEICFQGTGLLLLVSLFFYKSSPQPQ